MNSDYVSTATGQPFATLAVVETAIDAHTTSIAYYGLASVTGNDIRENMSIVVDDEVMGVTSFTDSLLVVKRGCFDTVPAQHDGESSIWFIDGGIGTDFVPYMGTEQIGIKLLPRTTSLVMDVQYSPPIALSMNQRFIRPYNVGQFKVNAGPWDGNARLTAVAPNAALTWVERNRIIQADQLVGYDDSGVAAEAGTTYHFALFKEDGTPVHVYDGITSGWAYTRPMAVSDFNLVSLSDTGDYQLYGLFYTARDGYSSWQAYRVDLRVDTTGLAIYLITEDSKYLTTEDGRQIIVENHS